MDLRSQHCIQFEYPTFRYLGVDTAQVVCYSINIIRERGQNDTDTRMGNTNRSRSLLPYNPDNLDFYSGGTEFRCRDIRRWHNNYQLGVDKGSILCYSKA